MLTVDVDRRMSLNELISALTSRSLSSSRVPQSPHTSYHTQPSPNSADFSLSLVPSSPNPFTYPNLGPSSSFISPYPSPLPPIS
ncbi:hypothetical protein EON65_46675, partial [archaeon]